MFPSLLTLLTLPLLALAIPTSQSACTSTYTTTLSGHGNLNLATQTVYTSTTIVLSKMNCGPSCYQLQTETEIAPGFNGLGPVQHPTATVTAKKPFTSVIRVCSAASPLPTETAAAFAKRDDAAAFAKRDDAADAKEC